MTALIVFLADALERDAGCFKLQGARFPWLVGIDFLATQGVALLYVLSRTFSSITVGNGDQSSRWRFGTGVLLTAALEPSSMTTDLATFLCVTGRLSISED